LKLVIDTNIVVSALIRPQSPPGIIIEAWTRGQLEWISSRATLNELYGVLRRKSVTRYLKSTEDQIERFLQAVEARTLQVRTNTTANVARDKTDDKFLEAAIAGEAQYIVTGDQDLLVLGSFEGVEIVTPAQFVAMMESSPER
jgi:putative PIN family toxin of toxin-antitoxin system